MKKKTLTIVMVIVVILIIIAVCIGLKSCSSLNDGGNGSTEVSEDGVVVSDEEEKDDDEANEKSEADEDEKTAANGVADDVADDIADWGDATEGIVNEDENTTSEDKTSTDKTTTDKNTVNKDTTDKVTTDSDDTESDTKKQYTITYNVNNDNATIDQVTQKVTYGDNFTLATPRLKGGDDQYFVKWVIAGTNDEFKSGIYNIQKDVSLTAIWGENYSKNY